MKSQDIPKKPAFQTPTPDVNSKKRNSIDATSLIHTDTSLRSENNTPKFSNGSDHYKITKSL